MPPPWWWVCGHVFSSVCVHVGQSTCMRVCVCGSVCVCVRMTVMSIVLSSMACIHCPSHGSMYRWVFNYVPQWSSLCFFTAQELSRQRSVCAPWKLPAENHMAMRAIMDFSLPLSTPISLSPTPLPFSLSYSLLLFSLHSFPFCRWRFEQMSIDVCFLQPLCLCCSSPVNYLWCILLLLWKCRKTWKCTNTHTHTCTCWKYLKSVRQYTNENNGREMLHYLGWLCDE